jgi:hypothetical protein
MQPSIQAKSAILTTTTTVLRHLLKRAFVTMALQLISKSKTLISSVKFPNIQALFAILSASTVLTVTFTQESIRHPGLAANLKQSLLDWF